MKIKKLITFAIIAALAMPLAACGDSTDLYEVDLDALEDMGDLPEDMDEETLAALKQEALGKGDPEVTVSPDNEEGGSAKSAKTGKSGKAPWGGGKDSGKAAAGSSPEEGAGDAYVSLGKDLNDKQLDTVLSLMEITRDELEGIDVAYVTNEEEHAFLDSYIDPKLIGTKALSSVLVRPREEGYGLEVVTKNISFCTPDMYENAFQTAGVKDADIIVAGPFEISGTAGLIGAVKAYERMSGVTISDTVVDAAMDELITTGDIADAIASKEDAAKLVAYIKAKVISERPGTKAELEALVRKAVKDLGLSLSDEFIERIVELILKIMKSGIMNNF